ncbi:hypothetical protein L2E82_31536 [Cichorium intybus]|uniref:Uncharacterized protein n=1 Tax=Cichorium intybus TaxID=13427 RepID=A0ACB9BF41_CICIN|nr:hypothetical protein L2E82_31536 [Cichorium intybus]
MDNHNPQVSIAEIRGINLYALEVSSTTFWIRTPELLLGAKEYSTAIDIRPPLSRALAIPTPTTSADHRSSTNHSGDLRSVSLEPDIEPINHHNLLLSLSRRRTAVIHSTSRSHQKKASTTVVRRDPTVEHTVCPPPYDHRELFLFLSYSHRPLSVFLSLSPFVSFFLTRSVFPSDHQKRSVFSSFDFDLLAPYWLASSRVLGVSPDLLVFWLEFLACLSDLLVFVRSGRFRNRNKLSDLKRSSEKERDERREGKKHRQWPMRVREKEKELAVVVWRWTDSVFDCWISSDDGGRGLFLMRARG